MENTMIQTVAVNLKRFRAEQGLTQPELAKKSGVSISSVKTLETCKASNPSAKTLGALARALNRTIGDLLTEPLRLERIRFRAKASFAQYRRINVVNLCARWLDDYCYLEDVLGVASFFKPLPPFNVANDDLGEYANEVRKALEIQPDAPIYDVADVLRKRSVKLWYCPQRPADAVYGLAIQESPQATGVVVFNDGKISTERVIFTTVHEFAHLLLHEDSFKSEITQESKTEERQADAFASYFLMPKKLFLQQWEASVGGRFVERVLRVKRFFRVSYLTVLHRLVEEKLVDPNVYVKFPIAYRETTGESLRNHREPNALSPFDVPTDRFQRLACEAALAGKISVDRAAEMLSVPTLQAYELINQAGGIV